ncbi:MAG: competence/damage-inducible protein A [Verrucomicrobia bacterium]|nr:competence/damage-inducible protein A [Verrucomicrobiota bacterium]
MSTLQVEIVNTGSELMLGRVLNTHQQWLCRRLADLGLPVQRQVAVSDTADDITSALRESFSRADWIFCTGGLGPTSDDLTRDALAEMLGLKLREDPVTLDRIAAFFAARNRPMPDSTRVQALIPEGAIVLPNHHGTAPGLVIRSDPNPWRTDRKASWLVMLPGPPRELYPMFQDQVIPLIQRHREPGATFACKTLKTHGLGESWVEQRVAAPLRQWVERGLGIGYCARVGEVEVRLAASGANAVELVSQGEALVRSVLGNYIYGEEDDQLPGVVVRELTRAGRTLALAESCTGGGISNRITNVPGASAVLIQSWVTYANAAKTSQLGVPAALIESEGAVSEPVARAMAEGARARSGADFALSVTGIAGPSGGTPQKPVGTAYVGLATPERTVVKHCLNPVDRETFKYVTSQQALELLRRTLLGVSSDD